VRAGAAVALMAVTAVLVSCQSYVAVPVQPATLVAVQQHRKITVATKADVLFVIDDSLSMSGKQQRLAAALANFTQALDALQPPVDYQVAVVSTSVQERFGACGPPGDPNAASQCDSDWGAPGFVCDANYACLRTFPALAGKLHAAPGAPPVLRRADYTAAQFAQLLGRAVQVGVAGARQRQGLQAMKLVLDDPATGLVRDGAKLVVAFLSDKEDCSDPDGRFAALTRDAQGNVIDKCAQEAAGLPDPGGPSLVPVSRYISGLRGLVNRDGSPKEIQLASIVSLRNGTQDPGLCTNPACDAACDGAAQAQQCAQRCASAALPAQCQSDCVYQCHAFCGGQQPGRRYVEAAFAFSGIAANICSDDASAPLGRLASVIGIPKEVMLVAPPQAPEYVRVRVLRRGAIVECSRGQGFDLVGTNEGTAVRFAGQCVLQPDDVWDVRYLAAP
jgi:hypothetical protein